MRTLPSHTPAERTASTRSFLSYERLTCHRRWLKGRRVHLLRVPQTRMMLSYTVLRPPRGLLWFHFSATADARWTCSRVRHLFCAAEVTPRVEDMNDRCCSGTVLIGAVVPRHMAGVRLDDSSAGWTTYRSPCSAQYQERRS